MVIRRRQRCSQRDIRCTIFELIFLPKLTPPLQRGLSAIAELLVKLVKVRVRVSVRNISC